MGCLNGSQSPFLWYSEIGWGFRVHGARLIVLGPLCLCPTPVLGYLVLCTEDTRHIVRHPRKGVGYGDLAKAVKRPKTQNPNPKGPSTQ